MDEGTGSLSCPNRNLDRNRNRNRNRPEGAQALRAAGQPVVAGLVPLHGTPWEPAAPRFARLFSLQDAKQSTAAAKGLAALPQGAGVAALVVMLALALPIGNFRALQNATPQAFIRQGDVKSIVEDRISAAQNAVTVAQRGSVSQTTLDDVSSAIKAMQSAKTARDISRADQQLTVAVSQLVDDANLTSAEDERMLTRAADTFAEQGSFLRQEARSYNQKAEKAEKLYEKLPTKFLLAQPDMYEGI